jgi:hypothetical protein
METVRARSAAQSRFRARVPTVPAEIGRFALRAPTCALDARRDLADPGRGAGGVACGAKLDMH